MKYRNLILILTTVLALATGLTVQGIVPPPDGGYPGGNTAEGQNALLNLTSGAFNTAVGFLSLRSDATGSLNTGLGAGTLLTNIADQNKAVGAAALQVCHPADDRHGDRDRHRRTPGSRPSA